MSDKSRFTIGADPEIFVMDNVVRHFISAHDLFPGTKAKPYPVKGGAIQVDGVAIEVNVRASKTEDEFVNNLRKTLEVTQWMLDRRKQGCELRFVPTATFTKEYFDTLPEKVKELGCTPDYDAFTGQMNEAPDSSVLFRTGAGHVHVGWDFKKDTHDQGHISDCIAAAKQLAAAMYIPSHAWDRDQKRRELYGKIGAFRVKPYGVESRFLSNAWLKDPRLQRWVYQSAVGAMELLDGGIRLYDYPIFKEHMDVNPTEAFIYEYEAFLKGYGLPSLPYVLKG